MRKDVGKEVRESTLPELNCRVVYSGSQVKVISATGEEFAIPMQLHVKQIFAVDDGILIQAVYSLDNLFFDIDQQLASALHKNNEAPGPS